ncbi:MAG: methyltransferase domain-containing protein [Enterococcus sp.]
MLKKIDRAHQFLTEDQALFRCPLCHEDCQTTPTGLSCVNNHRFDLSKKGTLYFLDHGIKTEYDQAMFAPRGRMIHSGMYQPVIDLLKKQLPEQAKILDVGCGEGSFLQSIIEDEPVQRAVGFDISKEGIYLATNQPSQVFWCVADLTNLPFRNQTFTTILNIFSPSHYHEFSRVLEDEGTVLKIVPQSGYLKELRQAFYPDQPEKQTYSNERVVAKFEESLELVERQRVTYIFDIPEQNRQDLLAMSPLEWQVAPEVREQLRKNPLEKITIDVELLKGTKSKRFQ